MVTGVRMWLHFSYNVIWLGWAWRYGPKYSLTRSEATTWSLHHREAAVLFRYSLWQFYRTCERWHSNDSWFSWYQFCVNHPRITAFLPSVVISYRLSTTKLEGFHHKRTWYLKWCKPNFEFLHHHISTWQHFYLSLVDDRRWSGHQINKVFARSWDHLVWDAAVSAR